MSSSPNLTKDPCEKPLLTSSNIPVSNNPNSHNGVNRHSGLPAGSSGPNPINGMPTHSSESKELRSVSSRCLELERRVRLQQLWFTVALAIIIVCGLIIIIVVPVLYSQLNHELAHHRHKPKVGQQVAAILQQEALCVPCDDFRLGPSREEEQMLNKFSLQDTENGLKCCVDTPQELMELLKMFVERRFRQEMAKGTIHPWPVYPTSTDNNGQLVQKPAAHLMMTIQDLHGINQMPGRQYQIGNWIHDSDLAFTQRTTYRHGRIVIPEDGLYFVYSQISFMEYYNDDRDHSTSKMEPEFPSLSHYLYRYNINYHSGGEEKLAQNSITKCWGQSRQYGEYTSYLGALFYLRNADEIFVKVSNISMVDSDPKLSYFGLYKI